jgi:hypothetical protein
MTGPFFSAKLWLTQAREDLGDFKRREEAHFSHEEAYTTFVDTEREPGFKVFGIKMAAPPETLPTRAAQIVNSLRSALDQATYRASVLLGADTKEKIYFPLSGCKGNFDAMFLDKGKCKNIPRELHSFLKGCQGYPRSPDHEGGNDLLYAIGPISNPNKHTDTYRIRIDAAGWGAFQLGEITDIVGNFAIPPDFDPVNSEYVLAVTLPTGEFNANVHLPAHIAFGEVPIIPGQPVVPVLDKMTDIVEGIVLGIEAKTAQILRERNS